MLSGGVMFRSRKHKWIVNGFLLATISFLLASCSTGGYSLLYSNDIGVAIAGNGSVEVANYLENLGVDDPDKKIFNCLATDSACDYDFDLFKVEFILKPKADEGWKFVGWENKDGYCEAQTGTCELKTPKEDGNGFSKLNGFSKRRVFTATFEEIKVEVIKPVIGSFTASPESIESGKSSTLSWEVTGTQPIEVSISGLGEQTGSSVSVSPTTTTTYTLSAKNSAGTVTKEVTIGVTAPPLPPVLNACEKLRASLNDNNALQVDTITSTNFVDPDGHLEFIFDVEPAQVKATAEAVIKSMILTFGTTDVMASFASTSLSATGTFQPDGGTACKISLKSIAEIAETPGTEVVLEGSISEDGKTMIGSYSFGTNGTLPGGKPAKIEFELKLKKPSLG